MSYSLLDSEQIGAGVARILHEELKYALQQVAMAEGDVVGRVHECRKHLKQVRSLARLVRSGMSKKLRKGLLCELRNAARELGGLREVAAHAECLEALRKGAVDRRVKRGIRSVQQQIGASSVRSDDTVVETFSRARSAIVAAQLMLETWEGREVTLQVLEKGISRSYDAARRAFKIILTNPAPEGLHEWRKRAKDLRYQSAIIANAWPPMFNTLESELHALTDHLGLVHDLVLVMELLEGGSIPDISDQIRAQTLECASQRCRQEQAATFRLGARLFAEKQGRFSKRVLRYLELWAEENI